jgi:TonB-linked SusC/RagA family outer membrane protein
MRPLLLVLLIGAYGSSLTNLFAQTNQRISGKITDDSGNPLSGVSVLQKGTNQGTSSDTSGVYSIAVSGSSAVLVFSYVDMVAQEIKVGNSTSLNVQMRPDPKSKLGEVVVVGYGTQRKVDVTGAVGSVTRKDFANKPFTSPDQVLAGRVSGVYIANRSGDPAAPVEVRIRGVGTAGNNQPLWVIDGVPIVLTSNVTVNTSSTTESNPLAGINPSDIESIDVLKDASATAIYGARAGNGVIMVTTRRGKEGRTSLSYDGYVGTQTVPAKSKLDVLNPQQYIALQNELGRNLTTFSGPDVDWQDLVFKRGIMTSHNLSVTGGTQNASFSIGGGYLKQQGIELAQGFERYSAKATSDFKVGKRLKFGESILVSHTNRQVQSEDGANGAFGSAHNAPYFKPYTSTGAYNPSNDANRGIGIKAVNYVWLLDENAQETRIKNDKIIGNVYGEVEIIKNLKYKATAGLDYNVVNGTYYEAALDYSGGTTPQQSLFVQERPLESTISLGNTLSYNGEFKAHKINALVGYEQTDYRFERVRLQGTGLTTPSLNLAGGAATLSSTKGADQWAIRGVLGRINYSYDDKYLFTFNIRRDESSRFSKDNRSGVFPSFSVGWRVSDEAFMKDSKIFRDLKLRASWGQSGNQFTGTNFAYISSLGSDIRYVIGSGQTVVTAAAPLFLANAELKWETTDQIDIGVDASMFNSKLLVTVDYFNKTTNDLLISAPIPLTSGFYALADVNAGRLRNTGIELALSYRNKIGNVSYNIGGNFTFVKNEFLELYKGVDYIASGGKRISVGESLGYFYGYKTNGIYQSDAEVPATAGFTGAKAGDVRFVDIDGKNGLNDDDRTKLGKAIPGYFYGMNMGANYKGFDLSIVMQGVGDFQIFNAARNELESMNSGDNQLATVANRWTTSNKSNTIPRAGNNHDNNRFSDRWIEDGDFLRIKNLQVGYNIPSSGLKSLSKGFITSARLYVGVYNLATFTKYTGYDPEVTRSRGFTNGENQLLNGIDSGGSPQPRMFQVGWQFGF